MGIYVELVKKSFQQNYVYRTNTYIHLIGSVIPLVIQISIWSTLLSNKESIRGITLGNMISFLVINVVLLSIARSGISNRLGAKIRDGSIATDFIKPINIKFSLVAEDLGDSFYRTIFGVIPVCVVSILFFNPTWSNNLQSTLLFIISAVMGIMLIYQINYLLGLLAFWLESTYYIDFLKLALLELLGGTFVPLWFYPEFLIQVCKLFPFYLITFEPIQIFLGKLSHEESLNVIIYQAVWLVALIILEKIIWKSAQKKVTIQGG